MKYQYQAYSHIGGRVCNEDSYCAECNEERYLFVVADGLGGHAAGETASAEAVQTIRSLFYEQGDTFNVSAAIEIANCRILKLQKEMNLPMKTTISVVWICNNRAVFAHVGDSRIYGFADGKIMYQSVDHSVAQIAVSVGEITTNEIRCHEDRHILTRALGVNTPVKIDIKEIPTSELDALLICSDGFWEYVFESEMCELLCETAHPEKWLDEMYRLLKTRIPANTDNHTAITMIKRGE